MTKMIRYHDEQENKRSNLSNPAKDHFVGEKLKINGSK